ncbi:cytochrome b/b6 domain-containing protein [Halomonas sp. PA16-9]|uniref:cytochrome b/b6 domain-containing protein n=1 Tax=Halomonas sp. PA16-9 TaxID=2576841 RepID=UPI0030EB39B4
MHAQAGYLIIGLLVFRWLWGLLGSVYARFKTFLYPPVETVAYSQLLLKRRPGAYASHNPLGGWMVLLMLLSLSFQAVSGLFLSDDIFFQAPLYGVFGDGVGGQLRTLHQLNSDLLIILIGLHLAGLIAHRLLGEPLVAAMLVGTKRFRQQPVDARNEPYNAATLRLRAIGSFYCCWRRPMAVVLKHLFLLPRFLLTQLSTAKACIAHAASKKHQRDNRL